MFKSINLTDFKGIRKCEKPIELSKFNLLIGPNNSGKTSILEALYLSINPWISPWPFNKTEDRAKMILFNKIHSGWISLIYRYYGLSKLESTLNVGSRISVLIGSHDAICFIDGKELTDFKSLSGALRNLYIIKSDDELADCIAYIPSDNRFLSRLIELITKKENWFKVQKTDVHSKIVKDFVSKVVSDDFTDVTIQFSEMVVRREIKPGGSTAYIDVRDLGDGVERFLAVGLWLEALNPKMVLWDDLEASAHPALISQIIRWLGEHDWQVVATTHSLDVLHEFVLAEPEDARVIQLKKSKNDVLSYKVLSLKEVEELFKRGLDVRKLLNW